MKRTVLFTCVSAVILCALSGCLTAKKAKRPETVEAIYEDALAKMRKETYWESQPMFENIKNQYPLTPYAVLSELRLADIYYLKNEYIEAVHAYEEFKRFHPTHESIPYVIFQMGMCNFEQILTIDRDQTPARDAAREFQYLIARYPRSAYAGKAMSHLKICRRHIAEHEFYVATYYFKKRNYKAALERFNAILEHFPHAIEEDKVLFYLGSCCLKLNDKDRAEEIFKTLVDRFPKSPYLEEALVSLELPIQTGEEGPREKAQEGEEQKEKAQEEKEKKFLFF
jgi:outer membrane protein assembly factor BamD